MVYRLNYDNCQKNEVKIEEAFLKSKQNRKKK